MRSRIALSRWIVVDNEEEGDQAGAGCRGRCQADDAGKSVDRVPMGRPTCRRRTSTLSPPSRAIRPSQPSHDSQQKLLGALY
jgi:hypothetical protein